MKIMEEPNNIYEVSEVNKGRVLSTYINNNLMGIIDGYEQIVNSAMNTVSQFTLNKDGKKEIIKVGLAFGKVQSGKTTYFHCVSACALDNNYDIIIVLSGVTKNLLTQNRERLKDSFRKCRTFLSFFDSSDFGKNVGNKIKDIKDCIDSYGDSDFEGGVFISVLKDGTHLSKIFEIVKEFSEKRILVIDDEGDQFSMNTKVNKEQESSTFSMIRDIIYESNNTSLLSVTATPQANVFAEIYNELSPQFIELVEPGKGYCGLETFHANDEYISYISGEDNNYYSDLKTALAYYLFTIYESEFHNINKYTNEKNWMLIHNSRYKIEHLRDFQELYNIILFELQPLRGLLSYKKVDINKQRIIDFLHKVYQDYSIKEKFNYDFENFLFRFSDVMKFIYDSDSSMNIKIINSNEINEDEELQPSKCGILIGGDMLGRGITIDGLTVSYLTRDTTTGKGNIDTILQRARWFGYRVKHLDLIKIFTTKDIQIKFNEIYQHDVSLYEELKYCIDNDIPIQESKIRAKIHKKLEPTRKSVIKKGSLLRNKSSNFTQQRRIITSIDYSYHDELNKSVNSFLNKKIYTEEVKNIKKFEVLSDEFEKCFDGLKNNKKIFEVNNRVYDSLFNLLKSNKNINVYIIKELNDESKGYSLTRDKSYLNEKVFIGNVLSGSSSEYEGDLYHFNKYNHVQIHFTKIKDSKGKYLYNGNKVLFIAVNNTSKTLKEYIRRV